MGDLLFASTTTALSKLADVATGNALISGGVGVAPSYGKIGLTTHITGTLAVGNGGTGAVTLTTRGVLIGNGTSAVSATAAGITGQVLVGNTGADPSWATLTSTAVTSFSAGTTGLTPSTATQGAITLAGTLAVANGGTGTATAFTAGSVVFAGASGVYSQDNANLFWDNTNDRLGIGTASPAQRIHAATTAAVSGTTQSFLRLTGDATYGADFGGGIIQGVGPIATISTVNAGTATERMRIDSSGNVGIGSTPAVRFQITQDQAAYSYFDYYNNTNAGGVVWRQIVRDLANTGNTSVDFAKLISSGFALNNNDAGAANFTSFGVGGTERMRITSAGNVGIGTTSPGVALDVAGTIRSVRNNAEVRITTATGYGWRTGTTSTASTLGYMYFQGTTDNFAMSFIDSMAIDSTGKVGIGTTTPGRKLDVVGPTITLATSTTYAAGFANTGGANGDVSVGSDASYGYIQSFSKPLYLNSQGNNVLVGSGNVGIGTTSPAERLTVNSASSEYAIQWSGPGNAWVLGSNANRSYIRNKTTSADTLTILNAGEVGIGTSTPGSKLDVTSSGINIVVSRSTTNFAAFQRFAPSGQEVYDFYNIGGVEAARIRVTDANIMAFSTGSAAAERMRIDSSGNLLVGTTSATGRLTVQTAGSDVGYFDTTDTTAGPKILAIRSIAASGTSTPTLAIRQWRASFAGSQNAGEIRFDGLTTSGGYAEFASIYATSGANSASGAPTALVFRTMNASYVTGERMRIDSAGKVGIGTSSPDATAILDVSSTTAGFLPPRMSTAERDAIGGGAPQEGLILYNVTTDKLQVYSAGAWVNLH